LAAPWRRTSRGRPASTSGSGAALDAERPPLLLLGDQRIVLERDLGVEAVGQHALVVLDEPVGDLHVGEAEAWELGDVAVVLRVELGPDDVDQLHGTVLACPGLEELLVPGADGPPLELLLDDAEPLFDLFRVDVLAQ
jgi:hypothetical protein